MVCGGPLILLHLTWEALQDTEEAAKPAGGAAVVAYLRRHYRVLQGARFTLPPITAMAGLPGGSEELFRLDILPLLVTVMREHIEDGRLVECVLEALCAMFPNEERAPAFMSAGGAVIVQALVRHTTTLRVLGLVSTVMQKLITGGPSEAIAKLLADAGAQKALIVAMRRHVADEEIMHCACFGLSYLLTENAALRPALLETGFAGILLDVLRRPRSPDSDILKAVFAALCGAVEGCPAAAEHLLDKGVLAAAMEAAPGAAELRDGQAAFNVLWFLSHCLERPASPRLLQALTKDMRVCTAVVLPLMVKHGNYKNGNQTVFSMALRAWSKILDSHPDTPSVAASMLDAGVAQAVVAAAKRAKHMKAEQCGQALSLLTALAMSARNCAPALAVPEVMEWVATQLHGGDSDACFDAGAKACHIYRRIASSPRGGLVRAIEMKLGDRAMQLLQDCANEPSLPQQFLTTGDEEKDLFALNVLTGMLMHSLFCGSDAAKVAACMLLTRLLASWEEAGRLLDSSLVDSVLPLLKTPAGRLLTAASCRSRDAAVRSLAPRESITTAVCSTIAAVARVPGGAERLRSACWSQIHQTA